MESRKVLHTVRRVHFECGHIELRDISLVIMEPILSLTS